MSIPKDGGPAFPTQAEPFLDGPQGKMPASAWGMQGSSGMTLRDYFAAKALAAVVAGDYGKHPTCKDKTWSESAAAWAYELADAMLAARERRTP